MKIKMIQMLAVGAGFLALTTYALAGSRGNNNQGPGNNSQNNFAVEQSQANSNSGQQFNSQNNVGRNDTVSGSGTGFNSQNSADNQHNPVGQPGDNQVGHQDQQVTSADRGNREEMVIETHGERMQNEGTGQGETGATSNTSATSESDRVFGSKILETGLTQNHDDNKSASARTSSANATSGKDANVEHQDSASDASVDQNQEFGDANHIDNGAANHVDNGAVNHIDNGAVNHVDNGAVNHVDNGAVNHIDNGHANQDGQNQTGAVDADTADSNDDDGG